MTHSTASAGIGQPVMRKEDDRLVTGQGRFSDDVNLAGQAYAVMVRSPHAHAVIAGIATADAAAMPGVLAVLTGKDAIEDGLKPIPHRPIIGPPDIALGKRDASDKFLSPHRVLPPDKARFAGEAVAMVVADSLGAARDAAERVRVDFEPLPAVTDTLAAAAADAPRLWDEAASNVCVDAEVGDAAATASAFARAAHVVKLDTWIQRVTGVPLEPRAAVGHYDAASGRITLYAGSGGVVRQKHELAGVLDVAPERVRVVSGDVGGNFGTRNAFYPEFALVAWASRRVGRPVKWTCERQEAFLSDYQGRDLFVAAELALDGAGRFLALRGSAVSNVGAHTVSFVPLIKAVSVMSSVYRIPAACIRARAVDEQHAAHQSLSQRRPARGHVRDRAIDRACGRDPRLRPPRAATAQPDRSRCDALRQSARRHLRQRGLRARHGHGAGARRLGRLCATAGGGRAARQASRHRHRQLRRDHHRGAARMDEGERCCRRAGSTWRSARCRAGKAIRPASRSCSPNGSASRSIASNLIQGDTDIVPVGGGSHSGRSMRLAGIVIGKASDTIIANGKRIAAHVLEAAEHDIEFSAGSFTVQGTDRSIGLFDVARAALERRDLADDLRGPFGRRMRRYGRRRRLSLWQPRLRGRDRPRAGHGRDRRLCRRRRRRPRRQSAHPARPVAWRDRARRRTGAVGMLRL